jgi:hypothetical protein
MISCTASYVELQDPLHQLNCIIKPGHQVTTQTLVTTAGTKHTNSQTKARASGKMVSLQAVVPLSSPECPHATFDQNWAWLTCSYLSQPTKAPRPALGGGNCQQSTAEGNEGSRR